MMEHGWKFVVNSALSINFNKASGQQYHRYNENNVKIQRNVHGATMLK